MHLCCSHETKLKGFLVSRATYIFSAGISLISSAGWVIFLDYLSSVDFIYFF